MANEFKVELKGLDKLKEDFSSRKLKKHLALGIADATLQLDQALRIAVVNTYNISDSLDKVRVGRSISNIQTGKNVLKAGLQYKFVPIPLSKFFVEERTIPANNYFKIKRFTHGYRSIKAGTAREVYVKVKRANGKRLVGGRYGNKGFYVNPAKRNTGNKPWEEGKGTRRAILERKQSSTWIINPFERAESALLFGPSLSQMAATVYETDDRVKTVADNFPEIVRKHLNL